VKTYRCHKVVQAEKVVGVEMHAGGFMARLVLDDGAIVNAPDNVFRANTQNPVGGYFVRYEDGYVSWSPALAFEEGYAELKPEPTHGNFGMALEWIKAGKRVARDGWNGKGLWVELQSPDAHSKMTMPYLFLSYPDGARVPWVPSVTDVLAHDWKVSP